MSSAVLVSIIIPNYNGKNLLQNQLPYLLKHFKQIEIIVADDGSTDGSVSYIKRNFPTVKILEKATRSGFSTNVNLGVKMATGEIIILLNTDALPDPNFLDALIPHFEDKKVFAVTCLDKSVEREEVVLRGRGIGTFKKGFLFHTLGSVTKTNTLWASGGSSAFKKKIWERLGGFDELYDPFYWEDIDLSYRALKSGYKVLFEPNSIVTHRHTEGSIKKHFSSREIKKIAYRNQFIFVWKNITDKIYLIEHVMYLPYHLLKALCTSDLPFIQGFLLALVRISKIIAHRSEQRKHFILTDRHILSSIEYE